MGVNSLWDIVGPAARPVKLEALSRKKLAVDASIWIYQFLKAVRDKEGNSLGRTHIVGFFRRICKLLYFGILPLFVFDGGAPPLKRQTIQKRKDRRQGNRENAETTAQKLLAIQVQRQAQGVPKKKDPDNNTGVYLEDLPILHPEHGTLSQPVVISSPEKRYVKRDEYHLPELKQFTVLKGDTRIMPASEFQEYADDASFDVVDGIDIDSVDPTSAEFAELPLATQYMILSHLRLKSRLRLGYTKNQLEELFPNSKDFSRFQIQQVQKRNFYTQRLMNVSGMDESNGNATRRIAGDKDKQYTLINTGNGWTLSLGNDTGPIDLDEEVREDREIKEVRDFKESKVNESDDDLEDIPLYNNRGHGNVSLSDDDLEDVSLSDDDLEDVSLSDHDNLEDVALSDKDDEEYNRAVIESIYDQYKGEYEENNHDVKLDRLDKLDNVDKDTLEEFDAVELRQAIDLSKSAYLQLKKKEEELFKNFVDSKDFDFGKSLLFGYSKEKAPTNIKASHQSSEPINREAGVGNANVCTTDVKVSNMKASNLKASDAKTSNTETSDAKTSDINVYNDKDSEVKASDAIAGDAEGGIKEPPLIHWEEVDQLSEDEKTEEPEVAKEMPVWFGESVLDAHVQPSYDAVELKRHKNDNEEAGLISWTEAQELIQGHSDLELDDIEIVEVSNPTQNEVLKDNIPDLMHNDSTDLQPQMPEPKAGADVSDFTLLPSISSRGGKAAVIDYDFEEQDEEQLVQQLQDEERQHAEFTSYISANHQIPVNTSVTDEQLLQEKLQKAKRDSDEVSETMIRDVQELLKRFGIPYMTAPMEAEAQCAELFRMGLVDGIVTDDSDCFLFGGSRVYKNMFNQKQYVECYIADDIKHTLGLDNDKLIELALLLGSDYTEGIKGVGPVLAMEILAEFDNLDAFKAWFEESTHSNKVDPNSTPLQRNLLKRIRNGKLFLPASFPDPVVKDAYIHPDVDKDDSEFKWGMPSLDQIRTFLMYNVGWSQAKVDEVMIPLVRDMNRKRAEGTQATIGEFFPQEYISYKKEVNLGKRMKVAASKLRR